MDALSIPEGRLLSTITCTATLHIRTGSVSTPLIYGVDTEFIRRLYGVDTELVKK